MVVVVKLRRAALRLTKGFHGYMMVLKSASVFARMRPAYCEAATLHQEEKAMIYQFEVRQHARSSPLSWSCGEDKEMHLMVKAPVEFRRQANMPTPAWRETLFKKIDK